jgi:CheY-like chemotaxis protein
MPTREEFIGHLRDGLVHLYDAERLRQSPLAALFGVANRPDAPLALRTILTEGIESLKPDADVPSQSRDWRFHDALFYNYVQQLDQRIVADQLGLSVRHIRREQRVALELLADRLWDRIDLAGPQERVDTGTPGRVAAAGSLVSEELAWLRDLPAETPIDLKEVLSEALELVQPLVAQHDVDIEVTTAGALPSLAVHPVALKQMLVSLLGVTVFLSAGGCVYISARPLRWEIEVQVWGEALSSGSESLSSDDTASLRIVRELVDLFGGKMMVSDEESKAIDVTLTLPALEQLPVLAIDDNADALQLLQRYAAGTRYRIVGTRDPEQALNLAEKLAPQIILLDVMMPQVDGWKVMGMLKHHPRTGHIPIVVCTILAQERLALALGASGFIQKPVTRQALLDALNGQIESVNLTD